VVLVLHIAEVGVLHLQMVVHLHHRLLHEMEEVGVNHMHLPVLEVRLTPLPGTRQLSKTSSLWTAKISKALIR